jgi:hypothetical protein
MTRRRVRLPRVERSQPQSHHQRGLMEKSFLLAALPARHLRPSACERPVDIDVLIQARRLQARASRQRCPKLLCRREGMPGKFGAYWTVDKVSAHANPATGRSRWGWLGRSQVEPAAGCSTGW